METFSTLLITGEFPTQRPVTRSFDVFFDVHLNKQLSKYGEVGDLRCHFAHFDVTVIENEQFSTGFIASEALLH